MIILLQNITLIEKNLSKPSLKSNFRSRNDLKCCLYEIFEFPNKKCQMFPLCGGLKNKPAHNENN